MGMQGAMQLLVGKQQEAQALMQTMNDELTEVCCSPAVVLYIQTERCHLQVQQGLTQTEVHTH